MAGYPETKHGNSLPAYRNVVYSLMAFVRVLFISGFILTGEYDLRFYSYINYTAFLFLIPAAALMHYSRRLAAWVCLVFMPAVLQATVSVAVAIVALIQLNSEPLAEHLKAQEVGTIHSGDVILHYFPLLEAAVMFSFSCEVALREFSRAFHCPKPWFRRLLCAYFALAGCVPFLLYGISTDWRRRYYVIIPVYQAWGLVTFACVVPGAFYFAYFYVMRTGRPQGDGDSVNTHRLERGGNLKTANQIIESEEHGTWKGGGSFTDLTPF